MLTYVHKCWNTLELAHERKGGRIKLEDLTMDHRTLTAIALDKCLFCPMASPSLGLSVMHQIKMRGRIECDARTIHCMDPTIKSSAAMAGDI
jgi:hypothetical protein